MSNKINSLRRFDFSTKAVYHLPYLDRILKGEKLPPISIEVHPTNRCNANCPMCFYKERKEMIETESKKVILPKIQENLECLYIKLRRFVS